MSINDVLSRISQIEQQLTQIVDPGAATSSSSSAGSSGTGSTASTSSSDFADALSQAQASDATSAANSTDSTTARDQTSALESALASSVPSGDTAMSSEAGALTSTLASAFPSLADSALGTAAGTSSAAVTGGVPLPAAAGTMLTSSQQQFASALAGDTGLNPGVVSAWLLAEENGSAAQSRQSQGNNDWLNVGYTDTGTYGANDAVWSDPVTAANATAGWLKGQDTIPGYGTASEGVQSILSSVGQTPAAQITALQQSGWASGGYASLPALYAQVTGG